jgi:hypothetical protein
MGVFPFGWLRGIEGDNWQILWNSETKLVYGKGAISKRVVRVGESLSWEEAKAFADRIIQNPKVFSDLLVSLQGKSGLDSLESN